MNIVKLNNDIYLIMDFWSKERCENYIQLSEEKGYADAKINTGMGQRVVKNKANANNFSK